MNRRFFVTSVVVLIMGVALTAVKPAEAASVEVTCKDGTKVTVSGQTTGNNRGGNPTTAEKEAACADNGGYDSGSQNSGIIYYGIPCEGYMRSGRFSGASVTGLSGDEIKAFCLGFKSLDEYRTWLSTIQDAAQNFVDSSSSTVPDSSAKYPFPPEGTNGTFSTNEWNSNKGSFTGDDSKTVLLEGLQSWWDAFKGEGERLKFGPHDPSWFSPDGENWHEGLIGTTTSTETQKNSSVVQIKWSGYGYYINTGYCINSYPVSGTEGIWDDLMDMSSSDVIRNGDTIWAMERALRASKPIEGDDPESTEKMKLRGCLQGQLFKMAEEGIVVNPDAGTSDPGYKSSYSELNDIFNNSSGGKCAGNTKKELGDAYLVGCNAGYANSLKKDTYFVRGDPVSSDGTATGGDSSSSGGGGGSSSDSSSTPETETPDPETPPVSDPLPLPESPAEVLDPCTVEAIAGGSEFYVPGDQATPDNQKEPRLSAKQTIYEALLSPVNNLSKEQVAAIMANIEGVSG